MLRINNLIAREELSENNVLELAIQKYKLNKNNILNWNISKKSIDARDKSDIKYIFCIDIDIKNEKKYINKHIHFYPDKVHLLELPEININNTFLKRPIIIGSGPAGLFAALFLIKYGVKPLIIEQGGNVDNRKKHIDEFKNGGILNTNSNIQFGEGGAGTFSDGKLTTGINSPFCKNVLQEFVNFGAPKEILYLSKPHLGTDNLINIIRNMREYIISRGGTFLFNTKVTDFNIENSTIKSITTINTLNNDIKNTYECDNLILAIGHSSRDTFEKIHENGFLIEPKNFSIGVRIEHPQNWINSSMYGNNPPSKLNLPPAPYKLSCHLKNGRSCYTFCMCPGGEVVPASSETNTVVTNGMSYYSRNKENANSALLVNVSPEDYFNRSPLDGMYLQRDLEKKAFELGGSNYFAPVQKVEDFLNDKNSEKLGIVTPSYLPGFTLSNLNDILPNYISESLKLGIIEFNKKIHNFSHPDSILTGVETRSSSPIKIIRNKNYESNIKGVFPCGEGSGYAGGIMSAAVDGIKCAISILEKHPYLN